MFAYFKQRQHEKATLETLYSVLSLYPQGPHRVLTDYRGIREAINDHYKNGMPAPKSAVMIAGMVLADICESLDPAERTMLKEQVAAINWGDFAGMIGEVRSGPCEPEMLRNQYLTLRRQYEPEHVKLVIVAESPPASGLYFYNPEGRVTEPLFTALMQQLDSHCRDKADGLLKLQQSGWLLIDATYQPVNDLNDTQRRQVIERDFPLLHDDLERLTHDRSVPLILIKENVCRLLEARLVREGFNVLNRGVVVPFPSTGHQKRFHEIFAAVRRSAGYLA